MANALAWVTSGIQYIVSQDFESAGTPSGWGSDPPRNEVFHNTTSPLEGTGDLKIPGPIGGVWATITPTINEYWMVALIKFVVFPSSISTIFSTRSVGGTFQTGIRVDSAGTITCFNGNSSFGTLASTLSSATLYYCKMYWKIGSGSDSLSSVEFSTTGTWVNSGSLFKSTSTGGSVANPQKIWIEDNIDGEIRFDHIRLSSSDLGNSFSNWI